MEGYKVLEIIKYDVNGVVKVLLPDDIIFLIDTFKGGVSHSGMCTMSYSTFILKGSREVFKIYNVDFNKLIKEDI